MNSVLQIFLVICILVFIAIIIRFIAKKQLNLRYTLVWLLACFFMLIVTIFPQIVNVVSDFVGIAAPVNTIFLFAGMFLMLIVMTLTFIVSKINNRIYRMAQTIALLDKRLRDYEIRNETDQSKD